MKTRARRERERDGGISSQCAWCYRFYAGPDQGLDPGKTVATAPRAGDNVSHGICPECADESGIPPAMQAELDARHGPGWRERLAELKKQQQGKSEGEGSA